jgi:hypothetical protein
MERSDADSDSFGDADNRSFGDSDAYSIPELADSNSSKLQRRRNLHSTGINAYDCSILANRHPRGNANTHSNANRACLPY